MNIIEKLKLHKLISILVFAIGCLLMIYMIFVEDEPGVIPSILIVVGSGWYFFTRAKIARSRPNKIVMTHNRDTNDFSR